MKAARILRDARLRSGLTQRELAHRSGVKQPMIARIESGKAIPRVDTLDRLLSGCGFDLETEPRLGIGIDRTQIREFLELSPRQRIEAAVNAAHQLKPIRGRARPRR